MFRVLTLNRIADEGMKLFAECGCEAGSDLDRADAIVVRSADMHGMEIPDSVLAIARAGAGYNNIPVEECSGRGIVVFNTPGANANAVKELAIAALFLSSRSLHAGMQWVKTLGGDEKAFEHAVEKGKAAFTGPEIAGKTLGVVGLGAIGVAVANDASALGMNVIGCDPYISVEAAWNLSRNVLRATSLEHLLAEADYVTVHVPYREETRDLLYAKNMAKMKTGMRLVNLARGPLVNEGDVLAALDSGKIASYVTDFPTPALAAHGKVLCIPHLGASTPEAEINCAVAAATRITHFLETGEIKNSVNFPDCRLAMTGQNRLLVANKNIPNMVGQITTVLAAEKTNITDLINHHKGDYAFNIIDSEQPVTETVLARLRKIEGVVRVRTILK